MKINVPMPVLVRGVPPRSEQVRDIWLKMNTVVDVPELSRRDFEAVLSIPVSYEALRPTEGILAREGKTYAEIDVGHSGLEAFTSNGMATFPVYIAEGSDMTSHAVSRPVQEAQSRRLFLRKLNAKTSEVWPIFRVPKDTILRDRRIFEQSRGENDVSDYAGLDVTAMEGFDECVEEQAKAAGGLVFIDGRLWAECGPPCIAVRLRGQYDPVIGLTTMPRWTDTSLNNAYFSVGQLDEARQYLGVLRDALGSISKLDWVPEFTCRDCTETEFEADMFEADRFAEVIGSEVMAAVLRNPELQDALEPAELLAAVEAFDTSKAKARGLPHDDLSHLALPILSAWEKARYPAVLAEVPANRREALKPLRNRLSMIAEEARISVPMKNWSPIP
jgi:hypothetical protein|nr:hypothetical protein [Neorhizobium tomejilense]